MTQKIFFLVEKQISDLLLKMYLYNNDDFVIFMLNFNSNYYD